MHEQRSPENGAVGSSLLGWLFVTVVAAARSSPAERATSSVVVSEPWIATAIQRGGLNVERADSKLGTVPPALGGGSSGSPRMTPR